MFKNKTLILVSIITTIFIFIVYLQTLAPTVWFIDSGELASVAITLGIAHPTGYPLFTLIGHLFSKIPIGTEIYRMNLMSSIFCCFGVFVMFFLMKYLLSFYKKTEIKQEIKTGKKQMPLQRTFPPSDQLPKIIKNALLIFTCLILGFSRTYWDTSNSVEVYPLHVFFIIILIFVFLKAILSSEKTNENKKYVIKNKYYLIFAFLLGLSFTNHLTTILLAPACLTLFFIEHYRDMKSALKLLGSMTVCFIISFSVYLYLPLRAAQNPTFIWGNPVTFQKFIWHITAKQFQVWIFSAQGSVITFIILLLIVVTISIWGITKYEKIKPAYHFGLFLLLAIISNLILSGSGDIVTKQFKHFFGSLWTEFGFGVILLAIPGIYSLSKLNGKVFYFTVLTFFGCLFYSVNYDIHDIDSYFFLAYITLSIWIGFGAVYLYEIISDMYNTKRSRVIFSVAIILVGFVGLRMNYSINDESKNYYVEEYTMNIFKNAAPNSLIISSQWDFWLASSWYFHFVKKMRPDLVVIDKELLRRSWYFKFIEQNYPDVYQNSKNEIEKFQTELYKFEHGIPYDQSTIMKLFEELMTSFVTKNPDRRTYVTWEIEQNTNEHFANDYARIPDGILLRLVKNENVYSYKVKDYEIYDFHFTPTNIDDYYHKTLMNTYAMMLTSSAIFLVNNYNRIEDARKYIDLALLAVPNYQQALEFKKQYPPK